MGKTTIEWCDFSINPIRARQTTENGFTYIGHYCEKVSSGCANCYASTLQKRFGMPGFGGVTVRTEGLDNTAKQTTMPNGVTVYLDADKLNEVRRRRKPTVWFWGDMTDLFAWWVQDSWLDLSFSTMAATPQHTHLLLTKRPIRMFDYFILREAVPRQAPPNVWLGISAENQAAFDTRWGLLGPLAPKRIFVSAEPLLGAIDFGKVFTSTWQWVVPTVVIFGGESGRGARPCELRWIEDGVGQCRELGIVPYVKQLGANVIARDGSRMRLKHPKGGDPAEWPEHLRLRELPWRA